MLVNAIQNQPQTHRVATLQKAAEPVRFGGISDSMAKIFEAVTGDYVFAFFTQDVIALWVPRIINALRRGREPYNVLEDPKMRENKPLQQLLHSVYMNVVGLNYKNAVEESLREVETGPGLLVAQSVLLGAASALLWGKLAVTMGRDDLLQYKDAFTKYLGSSRAEALFRNSAGLAHKPLEKAITRDFVKSLLEKHFAEGSTNFSNVHKMDADLLKYIGGDRNKTFKAVLEKWTDDYAKLIRTKTNKQAYWQQHDHLEEMLRKMTHWYNDHHLKLGDKDGLKNITSVELNKLNLPLRYVEKGETKLTRAVNVGDFMEHIRKFRSFIDSSLKKALPKTPRNAQFARTLQRTMSGVAKQLYETTIIHKGLLSVLATGLAGATVVTVSAIAQHGKTYPANRTMQLNPVTPSGSNNFALPRNSNFAAPGFAGSRHLPVQPQQAFPGNTAQYQGGGSR